jgi:hypothetical protein
MYKVLFTIVVLLFVAVLSLGCIEQTAKTCILVDDPTSGICEKTVCPYGENCTTTKVACSGKIICN